jgi:hypothetical protein
LLGVPEGRMSHRAAYPLHSVHYLCRINN